MMTELIFKVTLHHAQCLQCDPGILSGRGQLVGQINSRRRTPEFEKLITNLDHLIQEQHQHAFDLRLNEVSSVYVSYK